MDHTTCYIAGGILIPAVLAIWTAWRAEAKGRREDQDKYFQDRMDQEKKHSADRLDDQKGFERTIKELKEMLE